MPLYEYALYRLKFCERQFNIRSAFLQHQQVSSYSSVAKLVARLFRGRNSPSLQHPTHSPNLVSHTRRTTMVHQLQLIKVKRAMTTCLNIIRVHHKVRWKSPRAALILLAQNFLSPIIVTPCTRGLIM